MSSTSNSSVREDNKNAYFQSCCEAFSSNCLAVEESADFPILVVKPDQLIDLCKKLRDDAAWGFDQLTDLCGVDYSTYGYSQWRETDVTASGFDRAVDEEGFQVVDWNGPRFAVVIHLLSMTHNRRIRIRVLLDDDSMLALPSVNDLWPAANWFEREAYDLFGMVFEGHPDLRRLLTDYGFQGYPLRKDFPLVGEVEMRYDAALQRCVYEPVSIVNRVTVPRVIREDNRYAEKEMRKQELQKLQQQQAEENSKTIANKDSADEDKK